MNSVALLGRPTKDPVVSYTSGGLAIARFTLAVDRRGKDKGADFIGCVAFDKTAETIGKYCRKGKLIGVTGHIQTGSYDGKHGKVYTTDVIVDAFDFAEKKEEADELPKGTEGTPTDLEGFLSVPDDVDPFM